MVLSLFYNVINALGNILLSYKYRFSCQTVLALEWHTDFSILPKVMTKIQPCMAKSVIGNYITAAGAVYPKYTAVRLNLGISLSFVPLNPARFTATSAQVCVVLIGCTAQLGRKLFSIFVLLINDINSQTPTLPFLIM